MYNVKIKPAGTPSNSSINELYDNFFVFIIKVFFCANFIFNNEKFAFFVFKSINA